MHKGNKQNRRPTRAEALAVFAYLWKDLDVKQSEIASDTGLDQGSVSKILNGSFRTVEGRAYQLWKYAKRRADKAGYKPRQPNATVVDERLMEKMRQVWDHTEEGTDALLKLLDAADLIQKRRKTGGAA